MSLLYKIDEGIETKKYKMVRIDIRKIMEERDISIYELSRRTGLKYDTIKKQLIAKRQSTGISFGIVGKMSLVDKIIKFFSINYKWNLSIQMIL